jgi:hypothetical protein
MMNIRQSDILLLLIYAALTATGNLVLEAGASRLTSTDGPLATVIAALSNGRLWIGLGLYGCSFLLWLWLLSFIPLRFAYPISATSLVIAPLLAGAITGDFPQARYWIGLGFVVGGLSLVATR